MENMEKHIHELDNIKLCYFATGDKLFINTIYKWIQRIAEENNRLPLQTVKKIAYEIQKSLEKEKKFPIRYTRRWKDLYEDISLNEDS